LNSAYISSDGLYRYWLRREFGPGPSFKTLVFCMLNPSTADAENDDPTIRRCIGFAKREGYTALAVVNLFAYRTKSPQVLWKAAADGINISGPENETQIYETISAAQGEVVCAWGNAVPNYSMLADRFDIWKFKMRCLGKNKTGSPKHPLYISANQPLEDYP